MYCGGSHLGFPIDIKKHRICRRPSNDHSWAVWFQLSKKMAATAELSLTLEPIGKMFQNASSLKPLGQLKPNYQGMIIGRSSTNSMFFMSIGNP
jgi:hypothetical protein